MAKAGSCMFRIGYFLYTRTRVGYYYYRRDVTKAREKYNNEGHTILQPIVYGKLEVTPVPLALDNYAYIVRDTESNACVVIDVGDHEPVVKVLDDMGATPAAVLTTHKHWDHSAGNSAMKTRYPGIRVYGGSDDSIPGTTNLVNDKDRLTFGGLTVTAQFTAGHTVGHMVYLLDGSQLAAPDCVFTGDVLFLAGCGRMFECPSLTMLKSLDALSRLKPDTLVWPGHEYASENLDFTCHIDPENEAAKAKFEWTKLQRKQKLPTCPSTIEEELTYNPFLRTANEVIMRNVGMVAGNDGIEFVAPSDPIRAKVLQEVRARKDNYKYVL